MIKIRYHHLMCIPRFTGKGYSEAFCQNMEKVKNEMEQSNYQLVEECDEICSRCPNNRSGVCKDNDKVTFYDSMVKQALENGSVPAPENICTDCQWYSICKNYNC